MKKITRIEVNQKEESALRVAAYARVSTDDDAQLVSLKTQKAHYEKLIAENKSYAFVGLYFDEGVTGTKKECRDGLLKMLKDCEDGKIDFILTKSISRLARNTTDCLEIVRRLLDLNIGIYFEKENIDTRTMESELMLSILSSLAESESRSISENNKWSIKKRFQNGTYIISSPPYGYENVDGKMVVNEEEGKIIKEIFEKYLSGEGTHKIAEDLNKRKIKGQKGAKWHGTTINGILKNEKYIGDVIYQKTYTDENYNRHKNNGEEDQYKIIDNHEAIVSREDFKKAQDLIRIRARAKGNGENTKKYQNRYSLSGKITCGECGSKFKRRHHYNGKEKYISWTCIEHLKDINKCSMKFIRDKDIKLAFVTLVNKLIFGKGIILIPLLESLRNVDSKDEIEKINSIGESLERLKERKEVLNKLISSGVLDASIYAKESSEISSEERNLLREKERSNKAILGNDEEIRELEKLIEILDKSKMFDCFEDDLFVEIIDHIQVINRETLDFHLKCGLVLREEVKEDV